MSEILESWKLFLQEFESMRSELKDVIDIVAAQDKRIEQLEMLVNNG